MLDQKVSTFYMMLFKTSNLLKVLSVSNVEAIDRTKPALVESVKCVKYTSDNTGKKLSTVHNFHKFVSQKIYLV